MKKNNSKDVSELRQDLVSEDWSVIATARAKRPNLFIKNKSKEKFEQPISECTFENPQKFGNEKPLLIYYGKNKDWSTQVIRNKYPVVGFSGFPEIRKEGPYNLMRGVGSSEVVITRDHKKHLALLPLEKVEEVLKAYQERYNALKNNHSISYIFIFHNHGRGAGASVPHPHSQILAMPVLSADIRRSLRGAERYYKKHHKCVYCEMLKWEEKEKRCIFKNNNFVVLVPFVPRVNFELRIYPRKHWQNFEKITQEERKDLAEALWQALYRLYKGLKNPDYNFFIHTAPCGRGNYSYFHWHIEILPKTNTWAGIELGTGVEILTTKPEEVAKFLKGIKI